MRHVSGRPMSGLRAWAPVRGCTVKQWHLNVTAALCLRRKICWSYGKHFSVYVGFYTYLFISLFLAHRILNLLTIKRNTTTKYYYVLIRISNIKKLTISSVGKNVEQTEISYICWWEHKMVQILWKTVSSKAKCTPIIWPTILLPKYYLTKRNQSMCPWKDLYPNIYSNLMCNSQQVETTGE